MAAYSDGERIHGYVVHCAPRSLAFFEPIILDSYQPGRTFMTCLRVTRFFDDYAVELRNRTLTYCRDAGNREVQLNSAAELRRAFADDLAMPRCPADEAVATLERLTGAPFFVR
jgi:hypothetical protein